MKPSTAFVVTRSTNDLFARLPQSASGSARSPAEVRGRQRPLMSSSDDGFADSAVLLDSAAQRRQRYQEQVWEREPHVG